MLPKSRLSKNQVDSIKKKVTQDLFDILRTQRQRYVQSFFLMMMLSGLVLCKILELPLKEYVEHKTKNPDFSVDFNSSFAAVAT